MFSSAIIKLFSEDVLKEIKNVYNNSEYSCSCGHKKHDQKKLQELWKKSINDTGLTYRKVLDTLNICPEIYSSQVEMYQELCNKERNWDGAIEKIELRDYNAIDNKLTVNVLRLADLFNKVTTNFDDEIINVTLIKFNEEKAEVICQYDSLDKLNNKLSANYFSLIGQEYYTIKLSFTLKNKLNINEYKHIVYVNYVYIEPILRRLMRCYYDLLNQ